MSQANCTTSSFRAKWLLAFAIAGFAGGCSPDPQVDRQQPQVRPASSSAAIAATSESEDGEIEHGDGEHRVDVHDAHSTKVSGLPAPPATPWASDAPLREGMRRMHRAVETLGQAEHGHLDLSRTVAATEQVQQAANFMIANCKLAPEPDAALHGLLVALLNGAAKIQADPNDATPVAAMRDAIALYPRMFEDAGWQVDTATKD